MSNVSAISCREQVTIYDMMIMSALH
jgi:hypothetical protein